MIFFGVFFLSYSVYISNDTVSYDKMISSNGKNRLTLVKWQSFSFDIKYVKNGKQQKIGYFLRICMTGEQALHSSTVFTYISLEKFWFYIRYHFWNT